MSKMLRSEESPVFIGSCVDGEKFLIDGVNVWDHKWIVKDSVIEVINPHYKTKEQFLLYAIVIGEKEIKFIAGEFSNAIWGFYRPAKP